MWVIGSPGTDRNQERRRERTGIVGTLANVATYTTLAKRSTFTFRPGFDIHTVESPRLKDPEGFFKSSVIRLID